MAVQSATTSITYSGNNSTVTAYVIPFLFYKDTHIQAIITDADGVETELDLTTDFTVTGEGDEDGGNLLTVEAWDNTHELTIRRKMPATQPFVFEEGQRLGMKTLEKALDYQAMAIAERLTQDQVDARIQESGFVGPVGPEGPEGPAGTAVNSVVNAAIEDDPVATRASLGVADAAQCVTNLTLPTFDGDQRVVHVDVRRFDDKKFGYHYWMAYTPYPDGTRELPSVAASNDGINWELPVGTRNPLCDNTIDPGNDNLADVDLVELPNGDLAIYFISSKQSATIHNKLYRAVTSDGITWTVSSVLLTTAGVWGIGSPAIWVEDDDTLTMFVNYANTGYAYYTSADGLTWSAKTDCVFPTYPAGWITSHLDVWKVGSTYHALVHLSQTSGAGNPNAQLFHLTSTDKINWTGEWDQVIPKLGNHHNRTIYRSCLQPNAQDSSRWDVYLSGVDTASVDSTSTPRFHLIRGLRLDGTDAVQAVASNSPGPSVKPLMIPGVDTSAPIVQTVRGSSSGVPNASTGFRVETYVPSLLTNTSAIISTPSQQLSYNSRFALGLCKISGVRFSSGNPIGGEWVSSLGSNQALSDYSSTTNFFGALPMVLTMSAAPDNLTVAVGDVITTTTTTATAVVHAVVGTLITLRAFGGEVFATGNALKFNGVAATASAAAVTVSGSGQRLPTANALNVYLVGFQTSNNSGGYFEVYNTFGITATARISIVSH